MHPALHLSVRLGFARVTSGEAKSPEVIQTVCINGSFEASYRFDVVDFGGVIGDCITTHLTEMLVSGEHERSQVHHAWSVLITSPVVIIFKIFSLQ